MGKGTKVIRLLPLVVLCSACEMAQFGAREKGAAGGAALGAGLGAIIGNQSGRAGEGLAIGAALGALSGALVGNEIDKTSQRLDDRDSRIGSQAQQIDENRRMLEQLRSRGADARETERGVVVSLPDVLFEFDRATLTSDAQRTTAEIATVLDEFPQRTISIEGHTDSVGTIPYNQQLSEQRARAVGESLAGRGIARSRVSILGYGETDPIATNSMAIGRKRNRRVEVVIENN